MVNKPVQETGPTYTIHPLSLPQRGVSILDTIIYSDFKD